MFKMEKEMETCNVCGAFLVVNDVAKRLDAHYEGKQHIGFDKVRKELDRLKVFVCHHFRKNIPAL